ncbi:DMT family transporter [[Clostridium] polysaccharolyticum]|uniref:Transporter family-2 protein n=1 Tax=[Clostridium] polysaccharolyticum TaxID=29364 RepID=A0A1I0EKU2_9FIRM|nr:DMT family transporter [[Clostridium] polysaccharolyticum]SET45816.1 transporter family-2 protein [[Clostridium] polysaccharolyticum]
MWGILIAILSGALMSVQGVFNTGVTKQTGVWVASSFVQFSAFVVCIAAWLITERNVNLLSVCKIDNKYMLLGGIMGAFITYTVIQSVASLGPARAAIFIVTAQLAAAYVIELAGMFGMDKADFQWRKVFGLAVIIGGIFLFKWE